MATTNQQDTFNQILGSGINIYGSRETIRSQIIDNAKQYLQLQNFDFYKTSILSYIIDTLSILSANHLFYDSVIYREFFMVDAQMQDSVYNLARWIGYVIPKAKPSSIDLMFTLPLTFSSNEVNFTIPNTFKAFAGSTIFTINSLYQSLSSASKVPAAQFYVNQQQLSVQNAAVGTIINNSAITVKDSHGYYRPIYLSTDGKSASFTLPFTQQERQVNQFLIPSSLQMYQFFSKVLTFTGMAASVRVWVAQPPPGQTLILDTSNSENFDPNDLVPIASSGGNYVNWQEWTESTNGVYTMAPGATEFVDVAGINQMEIFFGNGIIGQQPAVNSAITVELYITQGTSGNIVPYTVKTGDKLYYGATQVLGQNTTKASIINYQITNTVQSTGGEDTPTLPEVKQNAIINLRSKERLVSDQDYADINSIVAGSNFPVVQAVPILKRSDIKVNEIITFIDLLYHDAYYLPQIVPTRNISYPVYNPTFNDDKYTVCRTANTLVDGEYYETLFNITIYKSQMMGYYDYALQNVVGTPVTLYTQGAISWYQQYTYIPITTINFNVDFSSNTTSSSSASSSGIYPLAIRTNVNHIPSEAPEDYQFSAFRCRMITKWEDNTEYAETYAQWTIDPTTGRRKYSYFDFEIPNYLDVPEGVQRFEFYIDGFGFLRDANGYFIDNQGRYVPDPDNPQNTDPSYAVEGWIEISQSYSDVMIRKDLSDVMFSSVTTTSDWDGIYHPSEVRYDIHNTPVILKSYMDDINSRADNQVYPNFEITVLQNLISNLNLVGKRMLTDSINVKFCDTHGLLNNLKYNPLDYVVRSRYHTPFNWEDPKGIIFVTPDGGSSSSAQQHNGDLYIVNGPVPGFDTVNSLSSYINSIAELFKGIGNGGEDVWYLTTPKRGMCIKVSDELDQYSDLKIIFFDGENWVDAQSYQIPLQIQLKVSMDPNVAISENQLKDNIKSSLIDYFSPKMGIQQNLDRSEIISVVRDVSGVLNCELLSPGIDIKFDYEVEDLTQQQLLDFTPQYVGFTTDSIQIDIE